MKEKIAKCEISELISYKAVQTDTYNIFNDFTHNPDKMQHVCKTAYS